VRNSVLVISDADSKGRVHVDATRREIAELEPNADPIAMTATRPMFTSTRRDARVVRAA
jgi:hypothetical protein